MPTKRGDQGRVLLAVAALRLRTTAERLKRRVLTADIAGGIDERGRYYVDADGLERALQNQTRDDCPPESAMVG